MFLNQLFEQTTKHAAFCFGRMNPPTVGHGQLIDTVADASQGGDYFIFASQTQDPKKNPLDYATKVKFLKALFPTHSNHIVYAPEIKTIMQAAEWLYSKGYRSVTFVAGSDRLASFKKLLTDYNGKEGYSFDSINFVSSGDRDPDADGIAGVSASSAREAAAAGNFEAFAQATGAGQLAKPLYDAVRKGMLLEGWKDAAIGAAMLGTIGGGAMYAQQRPAIEVDGAKWIITNSAPDYKARDSKIVTADDGKKYLIWRGIKGRRRAHPIDEPTQQPQQQKQERWREPTEIEPTDMWVNEEEQTTDIDPSKVHKLLWSVRQYLGKVMPDVGIRPIEAGGRVWTRGDGTRHRDPARLQFQNVAERDQAFDLLSKALTGARATQVKGEFGSDPYQDALIWKGKVFHKYGSFSIALGSASRVTNKNSVWQQKSVAEDASGYIPKNKREAKDPRWSNALSVDVKSDTPTKNAKALKLI